MNQSISNKVNECLNCKTKPCTKGCPLENNIPRVIELIKNEEYKKAYQELTKTTILPSICGRICPHMSQCMGKCVRGIKGQPVSIGKIEEFIGDMAIKENWKIDKENVCNGKIAIIGSGPAGLTCAGFLARKGFDVTIYEKYDELGGILRYGIPKFRLDREILDKSIKKIIELGINVKCGYELGKNLNLENLQNEYDAIFIAIGANVPWKMEIQGENLEGVYGGNTLLTQIERKQNIPDFRNKNIAIIGGGNVAMDCARTIKRLGANSVKVIYRRAREQMPAEQKEIETAINEGVEFLFQNNIVNILGDSKVEKIECIKTQLVQKEEERLTPVNIENSNYELKMDCVVMAIGAQTEREILTKLVADLDERGYIVVDDNYKISDKNVWAGGDVIGTKQTVAWAASIGRQVARNIENMSNTRNLKI